MERSETIKELATALSKFQGELKPAIKSGTNPFFKSRYADLASVWDVVREPLANNGLSITQTLGTGTAQEFIVETTLFHISGEWLSSKWCMPLLKNDPQSVGSVISYARRYSLCGLLGVAAEDDDAEIAEDRPSLKAAKVEASQEAKLAPLFAPKGEHWCELHQTNFFKTAKMKSFAHPILGTDTWCYEHTAVKTPPVLDNKPEAAPPMPHSSPCTAPVMTVGAQNIPIADADLFAPEASQEAKLAPKLTKEELYDWVAKNMGWPNAKGAKSWMVNVCKIPEPDIEATPGKVQQEISALQGWPL